MTEGIEAVKEAKKFIDKVKPDLVMNRVPKRVLDEFKEYCREELCGDYGMGLKWLWDFYVGALGKGFERTEMKVNALAEEVAEMQQEEQKEEKNVITTVDGTNRRVK